MGQWSHSPGHSPEIAAKEFSMSLKIEKETLQSFMQYYDSANASNLNWSLIFNLPIWVEAWWKTFGSSYEIMIYSLWQDEKLFALAPLMRHNDSAFLLGHPDVCDYLDFIAVPDTEYLILPNLLSQLKKEGIRELHLHAQRPDATIFQGLAQSMQQNLAASEITYHLEYKQENESSEIELPSTWDDYLAGLNKKQRHEVRRKLRRLENETGSFQYRVIEREEEVITFYPRFRELFQQNSDKAEFLTEQMENYFLSIITNTARSGLARFGILEVDGVAAAAVLYFDYANKIYLYNSGYNFDYRELSVGLLSNVLCIKESIEAGKQVFDFLKGPEVYKSRLGGISIPIYQTTITITQ